MKRPYGWNVCIPNYDDGRAWPIEQELALLQPDCWMNWWHEAPYEDEHYIPTAGRGLDVAGIQKRMREHRGETWLVGNEFERPEQGNKTPAEAVLMTHDFLNIGWGLGAEFNWCAPNSALNMDDYDGGVWMREYMRQLRLGGIGFPSLYGVHLYHSTSRRHVESTWADIAQWRGPLGWMGDDIPIVVTEFCAENEPLAVQIEVMDAVHALWRSGKIKGAFWYSTHNAPERFGCQWTNSNLCYVDEARRTVRLTPLGEHWLMLKNRN